MPPSWHHSNVMEPQHRSSMSYWWRVKSPGRNRGSNQSTTESRGKCSTLYFNCQVRFTIPTFWTLNCSVLDVCEKPKKQTKNKSDYLSRASSAGGFIIIQPFSDRKARLVDSRSNCTYVFKAIPLYPPFIFLLSTQSTSNTSVSVSAALFESKPIRLRLLQTYWIINVMMQVSIINPGDIWLCFNAN